MKSIYQNKQFAEYWDKRAGDKGEPYKQYVIDPIMFQLIGSMNNKTILDLGCGNGYLAQKFIKEDAGKIILSDISKYNLEIARKKTDSEKVYCLRYDVTKKWKIKSNSIDIIYSNMLFNEIENINKPIQESFRVLKKSGKFVFSVTHPAWDLYVYAQEKAGVKSEKFVGLGNYFTRGYSKYIMGIDSKNNPRLKEELEVKFEVEHYQRPISDYLNSLIKHNFTIKRVVEPELTEILLRKHPRFSEYQDFPIGLIVYSTK